MQSTRLGPTLLALACLAVDVRGDDFPVEPGRPVSPTPADDQPAADRPKKDEPADEKPADEPKRQRPKMLQAEPGEDVPEPPARKRRRPAIGGMPQFPGFVPGPVDPRGVERQLDDLARQLARQLGRQQRGGLQPGGFGFTTRMQSSSTTTGAGGTVRTLSQSDGTTTIVVEETHGDVTVTITGLRGAVLFEGAIADPTSPTEIPPRFRRQVREMAEQLGVAASPADR